MYTAICDLDPLLCVSDGLRQPARVVECCLVLLAGCSAALGLATRARSLYGLAAVGTLTTAVAWSVSGQVNARTKAAELDSGSDTGPVRKYVESIAVNPRAVRMSNQ